jgi:CRISPR-associated endonuclease/helicase Cas3
MGTDSKRFFYETFGLMCGHAPYPWQERLFLGLISGDWPGVVPLPTGSGKTAVLHIWLLALAWTIKSGSGGIPRRLAWVVNRRVVVDQVTEEASALTGKDGGLARCPEVGVLLKQASMSGVPLAVSTLRGQHADNGEWARDPSTPAILIGTVDMIGSRLLFRGYRSSAYHRPIHAGLLGVDTLIVNDEAHLSYAFARLLEEIHGMTPAVCLPGKDFRVMLLSATSAESKLAQFEHDPRDDAGASEVFRKIFEAPKTLTMHEVEGKALEGTLFRLASGTTTGRTIVFIEQPEKAAIFATRLEKDGREVRLLTGTMRGRERDTLAEDEVFKQFLSRQTTGAPVWLVATSAAEVGVNLTCERLVTGLVESDRLIQRFGRLNRFGTTKGDAHLVYVHPKEDRVLTTLKYLQSLRGDISCRNVWEHQPPEFACSERPVCARLEDRLVEAWAQTTYPDYQMPEPVSPWLHGKQDDLPETELAWRADVRKLLDWKIGGEQIAKVLECYPVRPHERLREPTARVLSKLAELATALGPESAGVAIIQVESDGSVTPRWLPELIEKGGIEYRLLILPDIMGRLDRGMFRPEVGGVSDVADWDSRRQRYLIRGSVWTSLGPEHETEPLDLPWSRSSVAEFAEKRELRFPLVIQGGEEGEEKLLYFREAPREAPKDKPKSREVGLSEHQCEVAKKARALAECVGLAAMADSFGRAALVHDQGKHREVWQRAFGGNMDKPIAKSKAPVSPRLLDGYRHELGSLVDAGAEGDDLALHLIASHHKAARPFFGDWQLDRDNVAKSEAIALEAARRYARLQRRFGPWGLAYLEAIFKRADALASDDEGGGASE